MRSWGPRAPRISAQPIAPPRSAGRGWAESPAAAGWGFSDFLVVSPGPAVSGLVAPLSLPGPLARV